MSRVPVHAFGAPPIESAATLLLKLMLLLLAGAVEEPEPDASSATLPLPLIVSEFCRIS